MDRALVGVDVGTSGVKALAVGPRGDVVAGAERGYRLATPRPGWAEQDPEDWWKATQQALDDLGTEPAAIGFSGQMHGLVVLDENDHVLRPAILWNDQRTAAECAEIEERIGLERLVALTGNRALPGFTAPKLLWLMEHVRDPRVGLRLVLLPKDYLRLRLTGELAMDVIGKPGMTLSDGEFDEWQRLFLFTRADTIYGGSDEIQRNILAERVLGLPREARPA